MIEQQQEIMEKLANLLRISAEDGFEYASCIFEYDDSFDDGSYSVGAEFSYLLNNEAISKALSFPERRELKVLVPKLHGLMKEHTGGSWSEMTLTLTADGQLKTEFKYPHAS